MPPASPCDPRDQDHERCRDVFAGMNEPLVTTTPVLTEAFYMLRRGSRGAILLQEFIRAPGISVWEIDDRQLRLMMELMEEYEDRPMDFADASLVAAAEALRITTIWAVDRSDFTAYRPRIGRTLRRFRLL